MNACQFEKHPSGWACAVCGRVLNTTLEKPPMALCRGPRGLGDMVANGLAKVGITKARAQAVANAVGVKDCGCSKRQAKLNVIGREWLGVGIDDKTTMPDAQKPAVD